LNTLGFVGRRRLKRLIAPYLPERLKAPFRARFFGYREAEVRLPADFSIDAEGSFVTIDRRIRLRLREEDRPDFEYHLISNGASVEEMSSFLSLARGVATFFDVGAAKGIFSLVFCLSGSGKRAVAFEPSPTMVASARALSALNGLEPRIELRRCAVGQETGHRSGRLFRNGFASLGSTDPAGEACEFEVTSLDAEVERLGVRPDLVKIDVEGFEHEVLLGARRLLRERRPALAFELHLDLLDKRGISPRQVVAELKSHGYAFHTCGARPLSAEDVGDSLNAILRFVAI
jgi:FkbM family methyltransferase